MVDLLEHGASDPGRIQREDPQRAEAQVADRRIGDQLLPILLHQADQRAVNDGHNGEQPHGVHDERIFGGVRQQREREAQEPVGSHLQQDAGQDHRAGRGRLGMRVGKPGMQRPHGDLHGEAQEEGPEDPPLACAGEAGAQQLGNGECVGVEFGVVRGVEGQDAQEHYDRADEGVHQELERRVDPPRPAPDGDDEVHGHQTEFPEDEEQQEIAGQEDAQHGGLEEQEVGVVLLQAGIDRIPARENGQEAQQSGEHNQEQTVAIDAEVVGGAEGRNPVGALEELEVLRTVEMEDQPQAGQEAEEGPDIGPELDGLRFGGGDQEEDRDARQGREKEDG